ncbi:uncharacterized protein LOC125034720 [Penaeus chinensis]|uniref:uncharacterized protein LOC125034720 n=1 Tax=Penaeus chinensis TaxID=139456 RepID=UPI001FB6386C|nr:uncharacterized protein LOC125034720 [Penaeus chinensis]
MQAGALFFLVFSLGTWTPKVFGYPPSPAVVPLGNLNAASDPREATITVTETITIDRSVVHTDQAYNVVPVTITDYALWTSTLPRRVAVQTPVDDDVAIQTRLVEKPLTLTVVDTVSDYGIVTDVLVEYYTITHTCYHVMQSTYTRTARQTLAFSAELVRTVVRTSKNTVTDYRTVYNTVFVGGRYIY